MLPETHYSIAAWILGILVLGILSYLVSSRTNLSGIYHLDNFLWKVELP